MAHALQTLITTLFPHACGIHLTDITIEDETVRLQLTATAPTAACPRCAVSSSSIHSRYQRHLTDLPWGTHAVHLQLAVRKFFCRNLTCVRRIFTKRLPDVVAAYARNTPRLVATLRAIGLVLGGNAGARLAARLRLPTSPTTALRLVRAASVPHSPALQAVGIDEWAWRRGHRYGTILVDLATQRVVDLLPDRAAASVAAWLARHPTITTVCRDRSDLYADGIRRGAPQAVQVVDRFHLVQNLRQALEAFLLDCRLVLQDAAISRAMALMPTAGLLGLPPQTVTAEPPPETTTRTLVKTPGICGIAPLVVAEALCKTEGFTAVPYVQKPTVAASYAAMAAGELDVNTQALGGTVRLQLEAGAPVVVLAGVPVGCDALFATEPSRTVGELTGTTISLGEWRSGRPAFLVTVLTHVGLDPHRAVQVVVPPPRPAMPRRADQQIDAGVGFPPEPQARRAQHIGHGLVHRTLDRPWASSCCGMSVASQAFVRRHPVATTRAVRAILKAGDRGARAPARAAQIRVDQGDTAHDDAALQTRPELPYDKGREDDPEDAGRFDALRLHEAGMMTSTPQQLITQHTDWRFVNALQRELKGKRHTPRHGRLYSLRAARS